MAEKVGTIKILLCYVRLEVTDIEYNNPSIY